VQGEAGTRYKRKEEREIRGKVQGAREISYKVKDARFKKKDSKSKIQ
jgi:hypothetical protein